MGEGGRLVLTEVAYQRTVYEVLRRQKIPREVNGSQNYQHLPKFDEFKDVTSRATKLVFAKEGISRQNIRYL